jgi:HlyD family secretion protein
MSLEFRKESLKKLNTPDDLDRLMPVTDERGWISLMAFGVFIISAIIWGFAGSIPTTINGTGVTTSAGYIKGVFAFTSGELTEFKVRGGDTIDAGELIAVINQPDLKQTTENASEELIELEAHQSERVAFLKKTIDEQSRRLFQLNILVREGVVEKSILMKAAQDVMNSRNELYDLEEIVAAAKRRKRESLAKEQWASVVRAPFAGTVTEVEYNEGDYVNIGSEILEMEAATPGGSSHDELRIALYLAAEDVKKVRKGMKVFIAPGTVKREEYGQLIGEVTYVSEYPKSFESIKNDLNGDLAKKFVQAGPPYKIMVRLYRDPASYSRYRWTSGKGPRVKITSGILCDAEIQIEERRPVDLVIPMFKKYVLGIGA